MGNENLSRYEKTHCLTGELPSEESVDAQFYRAQVRDWNARKCEAIALLEPIDPLLKIRAYLMRGNLKGAESELSRAQISLADFEAQSEFLLERARLAIAKGEWSTAVEKTTEALSLRPTAVSTLTLLQIRALALFENNEWLASLKDLEAAESLRSIFPKSNAGFYAHALESKVRARAQGLKAGRKILDQLWLYEKLNADLLLTLLRAELDLNRLQGLASPEIAIATNSISKFLGDQLYEGLALVDLFYSLPLTERAAFAVEIAHLCHTFSRIQNLCEEINTEPESISATALTMRNGAVRSMPYASMTPDFVWLKNRTLFSAKSGDLLPIEEGRIEEALIFLVKNKVSTKAAFFFAIWGRQKYSADLHDNLIWNLLSRLRNKLKIEVAAKGGLIVIGSYVLDVR